jgi:hypothetical protein
MAFFQNVFDQEYQGYLVLSDRKLSPTFKVSPNKNLQSNQVAWNHGPYDFSSSGLLEFNFSWDSEFRNWSNVSIDVAGVVPSSTSALEVVGKLNSDPFFSSVFLAKVVQVEGSDSVGVMKNPSKKQAVKMYFGNHGAETKLGFNKRAGVAELPEYFARHTIENRTHYDDSVGMLIQLDESDTDDRAIIEAAGFDPSHMKADWELLRGRAPGLFTFKKLTVDGSDRITQIIEYPAGALEGDFARKINYTYSGSNTNPSKVTEIPHVLTNGDLVTP